MDQRYGMTIPFDGVPLHAQRDWIVELEELGYTDVWSAEANGADAFTPLALASVWAPSLRLGTAIVPAFTRGPACMAQSVASKIWVQVQERWAAVAWSAERGRCG